jgi:ubiquinone/menaquinone biosynthesis C-methylase UbiE
MAPVFVREWLGRRTFPREPEPALVMSDPEQTAAYDHAGRIDGVMAAAYLFHTAHITQVIQGSAQVLDIGCGPATQLLQVAEANPGSQFIGVDLSDEMLSRARRHIADQGVRNVEVWRDDATALDTVDDKSVDAVISTMALHHLPTIDALNRCFAQIARVLRPGGALYLCDFGRLKSLRSVLYFAYQNAMHQPHLFSLDYERSLRAAYLADDFEAALQAHLAGRARLFSTFKVPFLVLIKSPDRAIDEAVAARLRKMRQELPGRYRRDLDDIRRFFALGGLRQDVFSRRFSVIRAKGTR